MRGGGTKNGIKQIYTLAWYTGRSADPDQGTVGQRDLPGVDHLPRGGRPNKEIRPGLGGTFLPTESGAPPPEKKPIRTRIGEGTVLGTTAPSTVMGSV